MSLANLRWGFSFFWDQRVNSLETQVLMPIQNPVEMGLSLDSLRNRLAQSDYYPPLFEAAFGTDSISNDNIARALAQFLRSMVSYQSKYDVGLSNNFADFEPLEELGRQVFFNGETNCNGCHMSAVFASNTALNTGLDSVYADKGLGAITNNPADFGRFKVPTLRNVARSAPYMHDGRFETLLEVIEHYDNQVQAHPNLDDRLTTTGFTGGPPKQLHLSDTEKLALIAFLTTLTDEVLVEDERFSNPFIAE
jgi:cytochrome c peroxidase